MDNYHPHHAPLVFGWNVFHVALLCRICYARCIIIFKNEKLSLKLVNLLGLALFTQVWLLLDTIKALTLSLAKRIIIALIASLWISGVGIMFFVLMIFALPSRDSLLGLLY